MDHSVDGGSHRNYNVFSNLELLNSGFFYQDVYRGDRKGDERFFSDSK